MTEPSTPRTRSRVLPGLLLIALVFAGGAGFWAWASENWFRPTTVNSPSPDAIPAKDAIIVNRGAISPDAARAGVPNEMLENGIGNPSPTSNPSLSPVSERLILVMATQRALERGTPHQALADALSSAFPGQATTLLPAVSQNAADPAGIATLTEEFAALVPKLGDYGGSWMDRFTSLAVIRQKGGDAKAPHELLEQAQRALQQRDIATAAKAISQHPGRAAAKPWLERANAHAAENRALDALEAIALAPPAFPPVLPVPPATSGSKPLAVPLVPQDQK